MRTRFEISADKQAADNEQQRRETAKALHEAANYTTKVEREEALRIELYNTHKAHGSLGMYYLLYPMDKGARAFYANQQRENERER